LKRHNSASRGAKTLHHHEPVTDSHPPLMPD